MKSQIFAKHQLYYKTETTKFVNNIVTSLIYLSITRIVNFFLLFINTQTKSETSAY